MLLDANSSIAKAVDRYKGLANRNPTRAVDVDSDQTARPHWQRHMHLLAGILVVLLAMLALATLQSRAGRMRHAADDVLRLALDVNDALEGGAARATTQALHYKLLDAVDDSHPGEQVRDLRQRLTASADGAMDGDIEAAAIYSGVLRDLFRAADRDARIAFVRTQQIQMGFIAGAAIVLILLLRSVAARRLPEVRQKRGINHPAQIDPLTGLGRIDSVRQRLAENLRTPKPSHGFVGLLVVGIQPEHEHFMPLTRAQLDAALGETARRLRETVRATDLVVRLAQDELAVALPPTPRIEDPGRVASKILAALDMKVDVGDAVVRPNPRVGVAIAPLDAVTPDGLIQRARLARRAASDAPAAVYRSYRDNLAPSELGTLEMRDHLEKALQADNGELWVAYQPKIDLISERVVGFEALARWDHPVLGAIPPSDFIAVAEESDLIIELGSWVLDKVCAQIAAWRLNVVDAAPVSVNVSSRQFEGVGLVGAVRSALERHAVPAEFLELELTEGILLEDRHDLIALMNELRGLGVKLAIDDFGTGYSALSYLRRFPIDVLKIDRAFIRDLRGDAGDEAISTAIISMAHSLELLVVAEGVETPEQLAVLRTLGCDAAQGFYFAHPAPPTEIEHRTSV